MYYSQSPLATESVDFGAKSSNARTNAVYNPTGEITKITIHHMAGIMSATDCAKYHLSKEGSSANYYIGNNGVICSGVGESRRAWTSSSRENDYKAITIEVSNNVNCEPWTVSPEALDSCIRLCVDICYRNGIDYINFTGDETGNLTQHCYFANTACPGTYLKSKFGEIADEINRRLGVVVKDVPQAPAHTLRRGSIGTLVKQLQTCLNYLCYTDEDGNALVVDGIFGKKTAYVVKKFQTVKNIDVDGIYGKDTHRELSTALANIRFGG